MLKCILKTALPLAQFLYSGSKANVVSQRENHRGIMR